ncbi:hypothetical protein GCM10027403_18720 [Arthrobacter tecti]
MTTTRMQSLGRGLAVLSQLVQAEGPLTSTEIANKCGMHQTTASRILADLIASGFVRKIGYREFAPDYGLLVLGLEAARHFPVLSRPRLAMERAAGMCAGLTVSLCMLWRGRLLYFDQAERGLETQIFHGSGYALHLSSPGLLFMLDLPHEQALAALNASRSQHGWQQPTSEVASTPAGVLHAARALHRDDSLVLSGWAAPGHVSAAIRLADHEGTPLALAVAGAGDIMTPESLRRRLHEIRRLVERSLPAA